MKILRSLTIPLVVIVAVVLASCEVHVYSDIDPFRLESFQYKSEYTYNGTSVVCDDRTTELEILLRYRGEAERVSVSLVGERTGQRESLSSFSPRTNENESGKIRRTFNVRSRLSPLGDVVISGGEEVFNQNDELISPGSIIVVPVNPTIIGYTKIEVRVESEYEDIVLSIVRSSGGIPVLNFCN